MSKNTEINKTQLTNEHEMKNRDELVREIFELKSRLEKMVFTNSSLKKQLLAYSGDLEWATRHCHVLKNDNLYLRATKNGTMHENPFIVRLMDELNRKLVTQEGTIVALEAELKDVQKENARLVNNETVRVREHKLEIDELKGELLEAEQIRENLIKELLTFPHLYKRMNDLKTERDRLLEETVNLNGDLTVAKHQIQSLKKDNLLLSSQCEKKGIRQTSADKFHVTKEISEESLRPVISS